MAVMTQTLRCPERVESAIDSEVKP
jgi:hypothetical protein